MTGDRLIGPSATKPRRTRREDDDQAPPLLGWRFFAILGGAVVVFCAVGFWRVSTTFEARDNEIEASRLQAIAQGRRDQTKALEARVSSLHRGGVLRDSAVASLGMSEPVPAEIQTVTVAQDVENRWRVSAAAHSQGRVAAKEVAPAAP